jgi:DNA-directed RNA polymerase specialized sigma24 family protein
MAEQSKEIVAQLPYLRRYARALTGSQKLGDQYVRICLEAILAEPSRISADKDLRLQLFTVFHEAWHAVHSAIGDVETPGSEAEPGGKAGARPRLEQRLASLPSEERQVLLLVSLEGFSIDQTATILGLTSKEVEAKLNQARADIMRQEPTKVLIIEDEPLIAMDIAQIVQDLGHTVCGTAARKDEALTAAKRTKPGLVLADIQLKEGDSGIEAVQEILQSIDVPVIFVTGFPERLLTGEGLEPAFLVTKPFDAETLKTAIGQALSVQHVPAA